MVTSKWVGEAEKWSHQNPTSGTDATHNREGSEKYWTSLKEARHSHPTSGTPGVGTCTEGNKPPNICLWKPTGFMFRILETQRAVGNCDSHLMGLKCRLTCPGTQCKSSSLKSTCKGDSFASLKMSTRGTGTCWDFLGGWRKWKVPFCTPALPC